MGARFTGQKGPAYCMRVADCDLYHLSMAGDRNLNCVPELKMSRVLSGWQRRWRGHSEEEIKRLSVLRDKLAHGIVMQVPKVVINGHPTKRLPNNVHISIPGIEGEAMLLYLDEYGICASTGSACDSQSFDPSHVILALGKPHKFARASIRFTLGRGTT